jgi:hypothetical protein
MIPAYVLKARQARALHSADERNELDEIRPDLFWCPSEGCVQIVTVFRPCPDHGSAGVPA